MIEIRLIEAAHKDDINLPNQPFTLFGRMIPSYVNEKWHYEIEKWETTTEMCFPDENYDFDNLAENSFFLGAYDGKKCIGLAILQQAFFRYMYLYDLKVNPTYRKQGVAKTLIEKASELAATKGYKGLYTQAQDNNLAACLFYLKSGFQIGGLDTAVYTGTAQEGKADIFFYRDHLG